MRSTEKSGKITFETRRADGPCSWEATIHQRPCSWLGSTEEEAIGNMLNGVAALAANGSLDPDNPDAPGPINDGPIQQCIELLRRKLNRLISESADAAGKMGDADITAPMPDPAAVKRLEACRRLIGNIGTALAALCRIESL